MVTRFALDPRALFVTSDRDDLDYTVVALGSALADPEQRAQITDVL